MPSYYQNAVMAQSYAQNQAPMGQDSRRAYLPGPGRVYTASIPGLRANPLARDVVACIKLTLVSPHDAPSYAPSDPGGGLIPRRMYVPGDRVPDAVDPLAFTPTRIADMCLNCAFFAATRGGPGAVIFMIPSNYAAPVQLFNRLASIDDGSSSPTRPTPLTLGPSGTSGIGTPEPDFAKIKNGDGKINLFVASNLALAVLDASALSLLFDPSSAGPRGGFGF